MWQKTQTGLYLQVTFMIEKERRENQSEGMNSLANEESTQETSQNCSPLQVSLNGKLIIDNW